MGSIMEVLFKVKMAQLFTNKKRSWFKSPIVAVVLVALVILGGISVVRAFAKEREAAQLRNQYTQELETMNERQVELETQIENLSTQRGIEAEIRERYRVAKPGEELVVVVDNGEDSATKTEMNWWQKLRSFVGI